MATPTEPRFPVSFPIRVNETHELAFGLFCAQVGMRYRQLVEDADEPHPVSPENKHRYIAEAIRETVKYFPETIRGRMMDAADRLAAELIGGSLLFEANPN